MNNIFSTLFSAMRAKFTSLWTRLRLWLSPTYWRTKGLTRLRQAFSRLFDVRPRHKKDYYSIFNWLVSKRLAFSAVVVLGVLCLCYISASLPEPGGADNIRTYRYNAIPLKFYSGQVRILDHDGRLAYVGQVEDAHCVGQGILYDKDGNVVYEGEFANSMFNGAGTGYYPDGTVQYVGSYTDNLYNGAGRFYRRTGTLEYDGEYVFGLRTGMGVLYNSAGNRIFSGSFQKDHIVYGEFLEKTTRQASEMYTGRTGVYSGGEEYCVSMPEIGAVYAVADGSNSLDEEWTVSGIYVLSGTLNAEGMTFTTVDEVTAAFGQPDYFGTAWVNLAEAVAVNLLAGEEPDQLGEVEMQVSAIFDDVYEVESYNEDHQLYLYSYQRDGLIYTLYCTGAGVGNFLMYAIEVA